MAPNWKSCSRAWPFCKGETESTSFLEVYLMGLSFLMQILHSPDIVFRWHPSSWYLRPLIYFSGFQCIHWWSFRQHESISATKFCSCNGQCYISPRNASGMCILYLPPYSPDFNPIEEFFSAMKAWIHCNHNFVRIELSGEPTCDPYEMLWEAVFTTLTPAKARGWFRDCGYLS